MEWLLTNLMGLVSLVLTVAHGLWLHFQRINKIEAHANSKIADVTARVDVLETRVSTQDGVLGEIKADLREIRDDIKSLLRVSPK